jgi:hypothetical protein
MMMQRCLTFLDATGDVTIVWDEDTDEKMCKIIEARMKQGYKFFVLKPRALPILPPRKVRAKTMKDIREAGAVTILDEDINTLFLNGDIQTMKADNDIDTLHRSQDAKEVSRSQAVAVKPARGG